MQTRKIQLDDVLWNYVIFRHNFGPRIRVDTIGFTGQRERVFEQAQNYVESSWMHSPWFTGYITATLLMTEIAPLEWPPSKWTRNPWLLAAMAGAMIYNVSSSPRSLWTWISAAFLGVALLYGGILERKDRAWLETLWAVSEELELGVYNGEALARRLQAWERKGRYAPSIIYSLLRRSAEAG